MSQALTQAIIRRIIREAVSTTDHGGKAGELRYGRILNWIGWVAVSLFLGASVLCLLTADPEERIQLAACFGLFSLLGFVLLAEAYVVCIKYDEVGMYTRSPWRRSRRISWQEVVSCDYSEVSQWYRIRTRSQGIVRVSIMLNGVAGLLRALPCEHPSYPPVSASGSSVYGLEKTEILVPGKPIQINQKPAKVFCWLFVAIGLAVLVWYPQAELPRREDFREVEGKVTEIKSKPGNKGSMQLKLRIVGAPALLACSARKENMEALLRVLQVGDVVTALAHKDDLLHPRQPWLTSEPQIWMVGLRGKRWEFLKFENHIASEKRDIAMLPWCGVGFILFGLGIRWQIARATKKLNQASSVNPQAEV